MVLGFKLRFIEKIMDYTKIHTIREDKHNRWKVGNSIQMATGVRTKQYNCFSNHVCKSTQTIQFIWSEPNGSFGRSVQVFIDAINVTMDCEIIDSLVRNDGFDSRVQFFEWFNNDFIGKIIHWTDFKYNLELL